jgi:hypothetical protein
MIGCSNDWFERNPKDIIMEEQVWNDPKQIDGLLANYYNRLPFSPDWKELGVT